jgi:hypothetical protein
VANEETPPDVWKDSGYRLPISAGELLLTPPTPPPRRRRWPGVLMLVAGLGLWAWSAAIVLAWLAERRPCG